MNGTRGGRIAADGPRVMRWLAVAAIAGLLGLSAWSLLAFPVRLSLLPSLQVDSAAYDAIAWEISGSKSLAAIPPLQPPGFVLFLAAVFSAFGHSWIAGRLALWACLVVVTILSVVAARRIYGRETAGWIAGLLCASSPALRAYAGTLQYELLAAALMLALVLAMARLSQAPLSSWQRRGVGAALLGLAIGGAILTREVFVVVPPVAAAYLFARAAAREGRRRAAAVALVCVICAAVPPLTWSMVQSARSGRTVTVSDKGPLVMAFGNNPLANGTFNAPLTGVGEPQGWAFIAARPRDAAWLGVRKAMYFWGLLRDGWNVPRPGVVPLANATAGAVPLQVILPWLRGGWLLAAFVVALLGWRRDTWRAWWHVPAVILAIMALHIVSISSYRFAIPIVPLLMVLAAGPLERFGSSLLSRRWLAGAVVVMLIAGVLMQTRSWGLTYELAATEFDGSRASNRRDERTGEPLRFADAARGRRPALLLADEYLPGGPLNVRMRVRASGPAAEPGRDLFAVRIITLTGAAACEHTVTADRLDPQEGTIDLPCRLSDAGPMTFLVETLGSADLEFGSVRFEWRPDDARR